MAKTFVDKNLLIWEAFPSGGDFGFPENPYIIFNCLSNRLTRPRVFDYKGDEADAERAVTEASPQQLLAMLEKSRELS